MRMLDYGCGKGHYAKRLSSASSIFRCYLYDISADYLPGWSEYVSASQYACSDIPESWLGTFDVITSLLSLEHVQDPIEEIRKLRLLLSSQGVIYTIVPNMYSENQMDMLVADHMHDYSPLSMRTALQKAGLELVGEDHLSHSQYSIYIAKCGSEVARSAHDSSNTYEYLQRQRNIAMSYETSLDKLNAFLASKGGRPIIIVGAGVIGSLIASLIDDLTQIACFVDSSIFKQKNGWLSSPALSPSGLDKFANAAPHIYNCI